MDFNEKEFDEYVSSGEEEDGPKNVEVNAPNRNTPQKNNNNAVEGAASVNLSSRADSMIFKPFRPGHKHTAFEEFPKSVIEISVHRPFAELAQRKLPETLKAKKE